MEVHNMPLKGAGLDYHHETSGFYNDSVGKGNSSSVCAKNQYLFTFDHPNNQDVYI